MKTTSLIAELLVIGVFGSFWILPAVSIFYELNYEELTKNLNLLDLSLGIAILYFVGMMMNYLSDILYKKVDNGIADEHGGKETLWQKRYNILIQSSSAAEYLFQRRSIIRIFRANSLNILLVAIMVLLSPVFNSINSLLDRFLFSGGVLIVALISFMAYIRSLIGYFKFLNNSDHG